MTDFRSLLERSRHAFSPPELPLEGVLRRRDRRRRRRRLAAGVAAGAIMLAGILSATEIFRSGEDRPADTGPVRNGPIQVYGMLLGGVRALQSDGRLGPYALRCGDSCTSIQGADWTRDGTKLAFAATCSGSCMELPYHGLRVLDLATGADRLVVAGERFGQVAWSPDGSRIAYLAWSRTGATLNVIDADGADPHVVLSVGDGTLSQPSWSPDGSRIVVAIDRGGRGHVRDQTIFEVDAHGSHRRPVVHGWDPEWSPDGRTIAYLAGCQIRMTGVDGSDDHRLVDLATVRSGARGCHWPDDLQWSPDGSSLAALAGRWAFDHMHESGAVFVVEIDGGTARRYSPWTWRRTVYGLTWQPIT